MQMGHSSLSITDTSILIDLVKKALGLLKAFFIFKFLNERIPLPLLYQMKYLLIVVLLSFFQISVAQKFTHADSLRGQLSKARYIMI